jgi:D-alanine-D-alanine ligase
VIVKPSGEDASVGIDGGAICTTRKAVRERLARMSEQFREVVVQEYIEGREFNVGFLGRTALPLSEISFAEMPEGYWRIVSYAAKWAEGSPEYVGTTPVCPAQVDGALADRIISVARQAWELLGGGEGYGRVDIRVAADGTPYVLEVNPNPDLSTDAGYAGMGRALGWDYDALVSRLVEEALNRARDGAAADSLVREVTG